MAQPPGEFLVTIAPFWKRIIGYVRNISETKEQILLFLKLVLYLVLINFCFLAFEKIHLFQLLLVEEFAISF